MLKGDFTGEDFNQRGLAGAVRADQHRAFAPLHVQIQVAVDAAVAIGLMHALQRNNALTAALRLREIEAKHPPWRLGFFQPHNLVQRLLTALRLRRFGRHRTETVNEFFEVLDFLLLVLIGREGALVVGLSLLEIRAVVPSVMKQLALIDLVNRLDQTVHEVAVVGNHQHSTRIVLQVLLEPQQRHQVQMVRRLVKQEQIRFQYQEVRQMRPHHPAPAELTRRTQPVLLFVPQPAQHLLRLGLNLRMMQRFKLCLSLKIGRIIGGPRLLMAPQNCLQLGEPSPTPGRNIKRRLVPNRLRLLRKIPQSGVLIAVNRAGIRRVPLQYQRKKRRLARPVRPHQRHTLGIIDRHVRTREKSAVVKALGKFADR